MDYFNLYYLQNGRQFVRTYPMSGVLRVVEGILSQGGEITGIINTKEDE